MRSSDALRMTAKVVATVTLGAAVGLGAGRGLAEVTGASPSAGPPTRTAGAPPPAPARTKPPAVVDAPRRAEPAVGVKVTFAGLRPAATPRGRARDRARLRLGLRVRNRSDSPVTIDPPRIQVGEDTLRVDMNALGANMREPLAPGGSAEGVLRFETAGAMTRTLMERRRTTLLIAGRKITVRYQVGPPVSESSGKSSSGSTTTTAP